MPFDPFTFSYPLRSVARRAAVVTPSDSTVFDTPVTLYVGGSGNLTVTDTSGAQVTFSSVPSGQILPLYVLSVRATGTTATNIVGLS